MVIKPHLAAENKRVERSLIGRLTGSMSLKLPGDAVFDAALAEDLEVGDPWPGADGGHLSCKIVPSGALSCTWYHPTAVGRDYIEYELRGADRALARAFHEARDGATAGRVQICYGGHVITKHDSFFDGSMVRYVGRVDPDSLGDWDCWIEE
jgi:hypothetical protein